MAMARAQYAANRMDVAQKYAEDVLFSDASNTDAKALLAAINLRTAFSAPGSNAKERNEIIAKALKSAAETQASLLTDAADKVPLSADPKAIDVHLRARRFSQVASLLRGNWEKNIDNPALTNRLLYTLLMAGRTDEFRKVYSTFTKYGSPDGYSYALMAVVAQLAGDKAGTDSAEKEVILEDPNSQTTKLLQIYLALSKGQYANMATMIGDLEKAGVPTAVVNNYKASNAFLGNNFDLAAKSMREALLADPSSVPVLIEQGNQIFQSIGAQNLSGTDLSDRATLALAYFEAALASSPSSFEALCAITMTHILLGNNEKAVSFGRAAAAAGPEYAGSHFILSGALRLAQIEAQKTPGGRPQATAYRTEMEAALKRASELDARLKNIIAPGAQQAWGYLYRSGRMPILPLPPQS
jgi:CRISPR/Cas system-associated protein endoribonuclease Cas2